MDVSTTIFTLPAGLVLDFAGSTAPTGYLVCDGSAVSRTTYARLFEAISTTWGAGDGSTTFNLPDSRGRASIAAGAGSGLTSRTLGSSLGYETHTLTESELASHNHSQNAHNHTQDAHAHAIQFQSINVQSGSGAGTRYVGGSGSSAATDAATATNQASTATNNAAGGGAAHNNMQPSIVFNKIIKY